MKRLGLLLCLVLASDSLAGPWQVNFADNPSFEADDNRDGQPDGWQAVSFKSPARTAWDRRVAHAGGASVRIADSANPDAAEWNEHTGRWISTARRKVTPGEEYALGVWIKARGLTGRASACIAWWKGGHWLAESYTERITGTGDWRHVAVRATAPPEADAAQVYLCLSQSEGTAWFDDVAMIEGDLLPRDVRPVDISGVCNVGFRDEKAGDGKGGWTDQGANDLRGLPSGELVLRGVPFRVVDPKDNGGRSAVVLRGKGTAHLPAGATIPLGRKCRTLYFLHACASAGQQRSAGRYQLLYDDGSTEQAALRPSRDIFDWWQPEDHGAVAVAWEGSNPERSTIGLGVFPLANPKPDRAIRAVRALAGGGDPVLMLVALTASDGPAVLTRRPIRYEFTDKTGWYAFNFPPDDTNLDRIDLTGFLDPPAGRHGFLTVREDGHFYFADGTRARFFGTNLCGPHAFPDRKDAAAIAARLAKYGVNLLRIHAVDGQWGRLIDYSKGDSRHLDAEALAKLDYLLAELKKRGVYVYFDLLDYRRFLPGDGVRDAEQFQHGWRHGIKGATIFNDRLIELQKEFATKFLTHANPHTKLRYVDDPAVAVVEITNENSVFYLHNTSLTLPCYVEELRGRWNRWLVERYGSRAKLAAAWTAAGRSALLADEDPARRTVHLPLKDLYSEARGEQYVGHRHPLRIRDMRRFLFDVERRYYQRMRGHLKSLGVKVPITGTNQTFCPASNFADACNDFLSRNNYWLHPNVRAKPFVTFRNLAVVRSDLAKTSNPITEIASSSVVGKPMISPEFNFPWPNEFRAECLPLMTAYACFQDWDGLLFFSYRPGGEALEHFGNQSDPVRWGEFPAAAMIFHRRDVAVARNTLYVTWDEDDIFAPRRTHRQASSSPFRCLPYIAKVRNHYKTGPGALPKVEGPAGLAKRYASDTGELTLDSNSGLFTIVAPRAKAAVGFLGRLGPVDLKGVTVECETPFAAVLVTSLDAEPISSSGRVLVTAVARAENTGQAFCRNRSAIPEKGRPPVLAEPVRCRLTMRLAGRPSVHRLDETGRRRGRLPADFDGKRLRLRTDSARSPWIEIEVPKPSP